MKRNLIILIFLTPLILMSQELKLDEKTGLYIKSDVIDVESLTKVELYKKTLEWIAINYKSAEDVIQFKDEESAKIILKGNFSTGLFMKQGWIRHTLILEFKDNKFRYTYTNLSYYSSGSGEMNFENSMISKKKILAETESDIENSIKSLTNSIKNNNTKEDW